MPRKNEPTSRTCIVTRAERPVTDLVRFVLDPAGRVTPDLRNRLPGRGVWVTANAALIAEAEKRKLFSRAFKEAATVEPGLDALVARLMREAALGGLSLARKAGELVLGFAKVEAALATGKVAALVEATDAGADGSEKIGRLARRAGGNGAPIPVIRAFTALEMSLALGRPHVIHAALLAGRASQNALDLFDALARFAREPQAGGALLLTDSAEPSAEQQSV
ncbi:MAG: RNA-binding protein [Bauldia sp.]|nr:RNA-binding protein [Bauldia sp.]